MAHLRCAAADDPNLKPFASAESNRVWLAYLPPTHDECAIDYHAGGKLFVYTLADGSTRQVAIDNKADDHCSHDEATPD